MALKNTVKTELQHVFNNRYVAWGLIIGCGWLGIRLVNGGFKGAKVFGGFVSDQVDKAQVKNNNPSATNADYNKSYLIADKVAVALGTKKDLSWWQKLDEDEETAAYELNKISNQLEGKLVKDIYKNLTGGDIYYHVEQYFDFIQIGWVNQSVLSWIK